MAVKSSLCFKVALVVLLATAPQELIGEPQLLELSVSSTDGGAVIEPGEGEHSYAQGTLVSLVAEPEENHQFVAWTGSGVDAGKVTDPGSPVTDIVMDDDYTLVAHFERVPQSLMIKVLPHGAGQTIPAAGAHERGRGETVTLSASPAEGYVFTNWMGAVADRTSDETSVTMTGDRVVYAMFAPAHSAANPQVDAGGWFNAALRKDGTVWAWGDNRAAQLGDGTTVRRPFPVQVQGPEGLGVLDGVVRISCGSSFAMALADDGTVWAWGSNQYGQLGQGTTVGSGAPVQVKGPGGEGVLDEVVMISAGMNHAMALRRDGTVWAWGDNQYGRLGDGTSQLRTTPVQVSNEAGDGYFQGAVGVVAGGWHSAAIREDGSIWTWGRNSSGQLGDGTDSNRSRPVRVLGAGGEGHLSGVTGASLTLSRSLVVRGDGTVWAWGLGGSFGLGDGTTESSSVPVQVRDEDGEGFLSEIVEVWGGSHFLALAEDGSLWGWGANGNGALGDGTTTGRSLPARVRDHGEDSYLFGVRGISLAGNYNSTALLEDGTVWAWGNNNFGQVGDGTTEDRRLPEQVVAPEGRGEFRLWPASDHDLVVRVVPPGAGETTPAAGAHTRDSGETVTITATAAEGFVFQRWVGAVDDPFSESTTVTMDDDRIVFAHFLHEGAVADPRVSAGGSHSAAVMEDGSVWAWGINGNSGVLGDGTTTHRSVPVQVVGPGGDGFLDGVTMVSAGPFYHTLALKEDGTVWAWGQNAYGQLGIGEFTANSRVPVQVKDASGEGHLGGVIMVSAGAYYSLAVKEDGSVWAWGRNNRGQLGDGTTESRALPVRVKDPLEEGYLTGIVKVLGGRSEHSLALAENGTVFAWGRNDSGQLGFNTTASSNVAVDVGQVKGPGGTSTLRGVVGLSPGFFHSVAHRHDGTAWSWGRNVYGRLGDGTTATSRRPIQVRDAGGDDYLTNVAGVGAGGEYSAAFTLDGVAWAWGRNQQGQLGDDSTENRPLPGCVSAADGDGCLTDVAGISAGTVHFAARKEDCSVFAWGWNEWGTLGDGTTQNRLMPVRVSGPGGNFHLHLCPVSDPHHYVEFETDGTEGAALEGVTYQWLRRGSDCTEVEAVAPASHHFSVWKKDGVEYSTDNPLTVADVTSDMTLVAHFDINTYTVTFETDGTVGATLDGVLSQQVEHGDSAAQVTANAPDSHSFVKWTKNGADYSTSETVTVSNVTGHKSLVAVFEINRYPVSSVAEPASGGELSPAEQMIAHGDTASFSVSPAEGHAVASVAGCGGSYDASTGIFTTAAITGACTITGTFEKKTYLVETQIIGAGGGISPESRTVEYGETASFTVTTEDGYLVDSAGGCSGSYDALTGLYTTGSITAACTVTISFEKIKYQIIGEVWGEGAEISPETQMVEHGESASFTVTIEEGHRVEWAWGCEGSFDESTGVYNTGPITWECSVTIYVERMSYLVGTEVVGSGGGISPQNRYVLHGDTATFTVTPGDGYFVESTGGCGGSFDEATGVYTTGEITGECSVTVSFELFTYTVGTEVVGTEGTVSPGSREVQHGDTAYFTVTTDEGYGVGSATGCGGSFDEATGVYTTGPITGECTVAISFEKLTHLVETEIIGGGGGMSPSSRSVEHGETTSFTVNIDDGYLLGSVTGCGGQLDEESLTYTTGIITEPCTVTVTTVSLRLDLSTSSTTAHAGEEIDLVVEVVQPGGDPVELVADLCVSAAHLQDGDHELLPGDEGDMEVGEDKELCGVTDETGRATFTLTTPHAGNVRVTAHSELLDSTRRLTLHVGAAEAYLVLLTAPDDAVLACAEATVEARLLDVYGNTVQGPSAEIELTLSVSSADGNAEIVDAGLLAVEWDVETSVSGTMPPEGWTTMTVSLDTGGELEVGASSEMLAGKPGEIIPVTVVFEPGLLDETRSEVTSAGAEVYAGKGSVDIIVVPRDDCGAPLGAGLEVAVGATFGHLTAVADLGDGGYLSVFTTDADDCPDYPAEIFADVDGVPLEATAEVWSICGDVDVESPVWVESETIEACASEGVYALVTVAPVNMSGLPLPPGQDVRIVENRPWVVEGDVVEQTDPESGATFYTLEVGSNRCSVDEPPAIEVRVGGVPLETMPEVFFTCPEILEGGVSFHADPTVLEAGGDDGAQVRLEVVDRCGNPAFGRELSLSVLGDVPAELSREQAMTLDEPGDEHDGGATVEVFSAEPGLVGLAVELDGLLHESATDLITFTSPGDDEQDDSCGCAAGTGGTSGGLLLLGLMMFGLVPRRRGRASAVATME